MRWLPIESNPSVMNTFMHSLGMPQQWAFCDVYGLDEMTLAMVPQPVLALLLLFPSNGAKSEHDDLKLVPVTSYPSSLYYMKQTISNACGTVAMLHSVANNLNKIKLDNGALKKFIDDTCSSSPEERALRLENDVHICEVHDLIAKEGQTEAPSLQQDVDFHFVTFVQVDGRLFELDGRKSGPLDYGSSSEKTFLNDAAKACQKYISHSPTSINFALIALTAVEQA